MAGARVAWVRGGSAVRVALIVGAMVLASALTGCTIQMALDTTVAADGSGTVGVRLAADKEIQDLMAQQAGQQGDLFEEFEKQVPEDWKVEKGTEADNGTTWVKASKVFKDPAELDAVLKGQAEGGLGGALAGDTFSIKQSRGLFRVITTFDATWDAGKAVTEAQKGLADNVSLDMVASVFQVENRLTLPGSIKENNATEVQGQTLVWRPSLKEVTKLHARSVAMRWGVVAAFVAAGAVLIAIVVVGAVLVIIRRRPRPSAAQV